MMDTGLSALRKQVNNITPVNDEDWELFSSIWMPFNVKKKHVLTAAGEKEQYLYFVLEGLQRVFYLDDENREATLVFTYPPSFGGVIDALMLRQNSRYYFEAITNSSFLRANATDLYKVIDSNPQIAKVIQTGLSSVASGLLERLVELQCYSSEAKFKKLLTRSPHILQIVPQKYLANYLGIDPTNFSKLINKVKI